MNGTQRILPVLLALGVAASVGACQTLQEIASLRNVDFDIDRVADAQLAGVSLDRADRYSDFSAFDVIRLSAALAEGELPLVFDLHLAARNPAENDVQARLVELDWTLLLDDRETVSGTFDRPVVIPPGEVRDVPIRIELDLLDFFEDDLQGLVDLALAATGQEGGKVNVALRAIPTVETPLGPIRYPRPVTIVRRDVGGSAGAFEDPSKSGRP